MIAPAFIPPKRAEEAFKAFVLPGILNAMEEECVNRRHLHVTCLIPGFPYVEVANLPILFEYSIGDPAEWERWDYKSFDDFARAKALITWRTGLSSREVTLCHPHLLRVHDVALWGSVIMNGVIVGVSGVQPHFDEMFARMTAAAVIGEASHYAEEFAKDPEHPDFLNPDPNINYYTT